LNWLKSIVNEKFLIKRGTVQTTVGTKQTIDDIYAVYVFSPEKARGMNGVILKEFLGIGDIRELLVQFDTGVSRDMAMYPCAIPRIVPGVLHNEVSTMMIAGIWRRYRTILPEEKWTLLASFNVMQFFCYNSSTNHKSRQYFIEQFDHIYSNICIQLLAELPNLQQCVLGDSTDLKSDDVLHTLISLFYVKQNLPDSFEKINVSLLLESIIKSTIRRQVRYSKLNFNTDLTKI
jgi:hypothetical protein